MSEPAPVKTLYYHTPTEPPWRPVVRLCGWASILLGTVYATGPILRLPTSPYLLPPIWVVQDVLLFLNGAAGALLVIGGIACLREVRSGRPLIIWSCAVIIVLFLAETAWWLFELWPERLRYGLLVLVTGILDLARWGVLRMVGPGLLILILRRPEARRVFDGRKDAI